MPMICCPSRSAVRWSVLCSCVFSIHQYNNDIIISQIHICLYIYICLYVCIIVYIYIYIYIYICSKALRTTSSEVVLFLGLQKYWNTRCRRVMGSELRVCLSQRPLKSRCSVRRSAARVFRRVVWQSFQQPTCRNNTWNKKASDHAAERSLMRRVSLKRRLLKW